MRSLVVFLCLFLSACSSSRMVPILYEPSGKDTLVVNYTNGLPIIAISDDSMNVLFALD
jgi:hypothetical protein